MQSVSIPPNLRSAAATIWAKSWPMVGEPTHWLPLFQHLDDSADVAGLLWDEWLAPSIRDLVGSQFPKGLDDGRRFVTWMAGVHDIGKVSPAFSCQVRVLADAMARHGLTCGSFVLNDRKDARHEIVGARSLELWLQAHGFSRRQSDQYAAIVGGHHGTYPDPLSVCSLDNRKELMGSGKWEECRTLLLDRAAERSGVTERLDSLSEVKLSQPVQMLVTALVIMADWIASNDEYFPLLDLHANLAMPMDFSFPQPLSQRSEQAWKHVNLARPWRPVPFSSHAELLFKERFPEVGQSPRPVQRAAVELAARMPAPGIMIIEAPMGEGKTEAALLAGEILASRSGSTGCFIALPTQATSNAMFARMLDWMKYLPDADGGGRRSTTLVHGKASLNKEFRELRHKTKTGLIAQDNLADVSQSKAFSKMASRDHAAVVAGVDEWMSGRKRAGLSSFVVGTIDQVLFAALTSRHLPLRHMSLAGKVVIIDEVHAADIFMSQFLDRALEWMGAMGTPVILLSATLPAARREEFYLAYEAGRARTLGSPPPTKTLTASLSGDVGYPSIVTSAEKQPEIMSIPASDRTTSIKVNRLDDDMDTLVRLLDDSLAEGGCALVLRNTVGRVQETGRELAAHFGQSNVTVAHAGFLAIDRVENDNALLDMFGKNSRPAHLATDHDTVRPGLHIVVASQVVEQSLDVDFDLMITDIAPIDLLLQRMGRLHRHQRGPGQDERPVQLRTARCYVTDVDWQCVPPKPQPGSKAVYGGSYLLLSAIAVLNERLSGGLISLPHDIAPLVQSAYVPDGPTGPNAWGDAIALAHKGFLARESKRQATAEAFRVPSVANTGKSLYNFMRASVGDADDSPRGAGYVRDGAESLEVVVYQDRGDGVDMTPDWIAEGGGVPLPLPNVELDSNEARILANCTVRLPAKISRNPQAFDQALLDLERQTPEGWLRSPFLSHQLGLHLDSERRGRLTGYQVRYDRRYGLALDIDPE